MGYIKNHKYSIEERAKRKYGTTEVFQFAGYLLENGSMLNFSYKGRQRDMDHREIGELFKEACGTDALLKMMRRGNIRCMCDNYGYRFEYIGTPTYDQKIILKEAYYEALELGIEFKCEKDNNKGQYIKAIDIYKLLN